MSKNIQTQEIRSVTIRFCGDSGDGMQLTGSQFTSTTALFGNDIATFPDYPAEIRAPAGTVAGVSGFQLHFSADEVHTPGDSPDTLIAMNPAALKANIKDLKTNGILIINQDNFTEKDWQKAGYTSDPMTEDLNQKYQIFKVQINKLTGLALESLDMSEKDIDRTKNFFALGITYWMYSRPLEITEKWIEEKFKGKDKIIQANKLALKAGYNYANTIEAFVSQYTIPKAKINPGTYRNITGNTALAIGLVTAAKLAKMKLFLGSYPITPASDILHELSKYKNYNVFTFQAEDEIAGICTAIGASFAGDLAITTTSGPGVCLKTEAIGLAVMTELPLVIVNVQRGGPSTGQPTKTEQADLLQAMYGRNGESPVPVVTASSPADCFLMAIEACRIALQFMTPVFYLTDGYIANGSEPWKLPELDKLPELKNNVITESNDPSGKKPYLVYKRREDTLARDWAIPGTVGLEHRIGGLEKDFLTGDVSNDADNHERMVHIRQKKIDNIANFIPEQTIYGEQSGELLVLGWGSTMGSIRGAIDECRANGLKVSHAQLQYINPFPKNLGDILSKFKKVLIPELNNGQLAFLIQGTFCRKVEKLNKIKGKPFTISEIKSKIEDLLK